MICKSITLAETSITISLTLYYITTGLDPLSQVHKYNLTFIEVFDTEKKT